MSFHGSRTKTSTDPHLLVLRQRTWDPHGSTLRASSHASIKAGTEWIMYSNDGCYGTDHIPITPQFLLVAFRFTPRGSEEIWSPHSAVAPATNTHTPTAFLPHSSSIDSAQQDFLADVRLRAHLHAPPATIIPAEDDDELLDATPDIDVPISTAVSSALTHLEQAVDDMHSASPKSLSFDPLFYLALSSLPLTYPWPILTIDLKNFLPLMDRHVLTHLVAAQASVNPRFQHPAPVLGSFFKDLAHAVVHTILASQLPAHASKSTATGFHRRVLACPLQLCRTTAIGSMDGLAGDQICQWNSVAPDSILPATHLSIFVPPPLGAFVLANHQNHEDFKSTPASATQSSPIFSVQQNIQFPLPQVFSNQDELLSLARLSAAEGYLTGHSHQPITFKKVRWALRQKIPLAAVSLPLLRFDRVLEAVKPSMALSGSPPRLPMLTKILSIYSSRTSLSSPTLKTSTAKSRAMSSPLLLMNTLFAGCAPRLPG